ncbi:MAG: LamG-like jellyroll fold domain-containing protein [Planctomycetales bacterium]
MRFSFAFVRSRTRRATSSLIGATTLLLTLADFGTTDAFADFQAGAAVVDVTPTKLPAIVNGGLVSRSVGEVKTRLNARALALSDGTTKLVIVVVDSCMLPRPLLDEVKKLAQSRTGVPMDRLLISATHTHSAPASMACLGTDIDPDYVPLVKLKIVDAIAAALAKLQPAQVGFGKEDAADFTALRRWIRRPDRIANDPFGNPTVRATMHAGNNWDNVTGESGPEDPDLSLVSIQSKDGKPIAVLANFSMHYYSGERGLSADYFGLFSEGMKQRIAPEGDFVGIMSHGCSGDIWRRDYTQPDKWIPKQTIDEYTSELLDVAMKAYRSIEYRSDVDIGMAEQRMTLKYRVADQQRLEWARRIVESLGDKAPTTQPEVYAMEQLILHERQETEIVVQGIRIGDIGIATTPNETYAITGLKIKAASPLAHNMVIELANGGDGYIPPPEQHRFGGYNTWAARSAGLEVMAEPKITEAGISLLEEVADKPRREYRLSRGPASERIAAMKPAAWWRLNEFAGPFATDSSGNGRDAVYEPDVTYYLEGPRSSAFCDHGEANRAAMFVGGRLRARVPGVGDDYSISLWLWNGMPDASRPVSGWLFSRGRDNGLSKWSEHLGVGGTSGHSGKLIFLQGNDPTRVVAGKSSIARWQWQHVAFVRCEKSVSIYLNGQKEIEVSANVDFPAGFDHLFLGGRSDNDSNWEGRLDEIAVFDRALDASEVSRLVE